MPAEDDLDQEPIDPKVRRRNALIGFLGLLLIAAVLVGAFLLATMLAD